ncbi:hypothetical protein B0T25DRAFT_164517 [Lasiosphaeria hispida]|uniref:Transmembrane protein n=1 Tax=Lasiosphaeria hispida TaxID=260671 RepID=A0AAJ0HMG8_9PEZI|nr:hypothetical protein B0T25DRAFT_164517 [Lasiosphaeria hispida]
MDGYEVDWIELGQTGREEMTRFSFCQKGWTFDRFVRVCFFSYLHFSFLIWFPFCCFFSRGGTSEIETLFGAAGHGNGGFVVWLLLVLRCVSGLLSLFFACPSRSSKLSTGGWIHLAFYLFGRVSIPLLPGLQ